jgi:hypothetical protein
MVIAMLRQPEGATVDEVASVTGWQRHTVRGVFSGSLKKKLGLTLASAKEERGRVYRIAEPADGFLSSLAHPDLFHRGGHPHGSTNPAFCRACMCVSHVVGRRTTAHKDPASRHSVRREPRVGDVVRARPGPENPGL